MNIENNNKINKYIEIFNTWNKVHNISAFRSISSLKDNIKDSLNPLNLNEIKELFSASSVILDIGSGNGLPAAPLALALNKPVIFCEPNAKKSAFLNILCIELKMNAKVYRGKIENLNLENLQEILNAILKDTLNTENNKIIITSRATFCVKDFIQKIEHLFKKDSIKYKIEILAILLYKGEYLEQELNEFKNNNFKQKIFNLERRNLLLLKKE